MVKRRGPGQFGYARLTVPGEPIKEFTTVTCGHWPCTALFEVKPYTDPASVGGKCYVCGRYVCAECAAKKECLPVEEGMELDYRNARRRVIW